MLHDSTITKKEEEATKAFKEHSLNSSPLVLPFHPSILSLFSVPSVFPLLARPVDITQPSNSRPYLFQNVSVVRREGEENESGSATVYRLCYDFYTTHR